MRGHITDIVKKSANDIAVEHDRDRGPGCIEQAIAHRLPELCVREVILENDVIGGVSLSPPAGDPEIDSALHTPAAMLRDDRLAGAVIRPQGRGLRGLELVAQVSAVPVRALGIPGIVAYAYQEPVFRA